MLETALVATALFFTTLTPINAAAVFASLTSKMGQREKHTLALRATLIASIILFTFAFSGQFILAYLGISLPALRIGGGILLLLIGIDLVFGRESDATSATEAEQAEASKRQDIAAFPMGIPVIAGPGAIGASMLIFSNAENWQEKITVILSLTAMLLLTYFLMRISVRIQQIFGETGMNVITRVMGILLTTLAVQFMIDGAGEIGLINPPQ